MHTKKPAKNWRLLIGEWGLGKGDLLFYKTMHPKHRKLSTAGEELDNQSFSSVTIK